MQVIFFFLCLLFILLLTPYFVTAEIVFDGTRQKGGLRLKLFGVFTVFRALAAIQDRVTKIHTKKDRYIFVEIVEAAANIIAGGAKDSPPLWIANAVKLDEVSIIARCGITDSVEAIYASALINAVCGTLFALTRSLSPDTRINVSYTASTDKSLKIYARSMIFFRPITLITKFFIRKSAKKLYGTTKSAKSN